MSKIYNLLEKQETCMLFPRNTAARLYILNFRLGTFQKVVTDSIWHNVHNNINAYFTSILLSLIAKLEKPGH